LADQIANLAKQSHNMLYLQLPTIISFEVNHILFGWYDKIKIKCGKATPRLNVRQPNHLTYEARSKQNEQTSSFMS